MIAQKQEFIGISLNSEIPSGDNIKAGFGVLYENQLSKHHGFELGLNYRSKIESNYFTIPASGIVNQLADIREDYLSLPISYKFYSNIVNLSTGISFDYFVGWKDLTKFGNVELTSYSVDPKLYVGWIFKVGKTIKLSSKFILEPEIQLNPIFDYGYSYYGAFIKLKYKL